jgi:hypothetical protein
MADSFPAASELHVNILWAGATFVMTLRASCSAAWGIPEVESGCSDQLDALPAYRAAISKISGFCLSTGGAGALH